MMNFEKKPENTYDAIAPGNYEVIITSAEERMTQGGKENISLRLCIRNDVDQPHKNRSLFLNLWKKREPNADDLQVGGYSYYQLYHVMECCGAFSHGTTFETMEQMCSAMLNGLLLVTVTHYTKDGKLYESINPVSGVAETECDDCHHVFSTPRQSPAYDAPAQKPQESFYVPPVPALHQPPASSDFVPLIDDSELPF